MIRHLLAISSRQSMWQNKGSTVLLFNSFHRIYHLLYETYFKTSNLHRKKLNEFRSSYCRWKLCNALINSLQHENIFMTFCTLKIVHAINLTPWQHEYYIIFSEICISCRTRYTIIKLDIHICIIYKYILCTCMDTYSHNLSCILRFYHLKHFYLFLYTNTKKLPCTWLTN